MNLQVTQLICDMYVFFSYLPNFSEATLSWLNCDLDHDLGKGIHDEAWWLNEGVRVWKETMADEVAQTIPNAIHVLPLSGGLDSRAILGGLLENLPKSQIMTATYGMPGAWDFEIGKMVAHKVGVCHEPFDLSKVDWDLDQLLEVAGTLNTPVDVHQCYLRRKINEHFGPSCIYWSGFLGDAVSGMCLPKVPNTDQRAAIELLIKLRPTPNFKDQSFKERMVGKFIAECPWQELDSQKKFNLDLQLELGICQRRLTRSIVIVNGYEFKTPFANKMWLDFISNVPYQWIFGQRLYKNILLSAYPDLFALPVTNNYGTPLNSPRIKSFFNRAKVRAKTDLAYIFNKSTIHPRTNYVYFSEALRQKRDFQELVLSNLQQLIKKGVYLEDDINQWWNNHIERKQDNATLLMNLSSLNVLLMANNF
jgi:hypothetical protein